MNLSSKPTTRRVGTREVIELRGRRWPVSYALPAFACTAVWLFLTVWLPAGGMQQVQALEPVAALPTVPAAQASPTWPEPTVREEAVAQAEPAPTF